MSILNPNISRYLVADQGEVVIDKVRKYWAALVIPWMEVLVGGVLLLAGLAPGAPIALLLSAAGAIVGGHGTWRVVGEYRDVFVITNIRVFRVHGILNQQIATMPLTRVLDVSVIKPFIGRILGYADFVFESAAQAQGLRVISYVGEPDERARTIQRVITEAGLRGFVSPVSGTPERTSEAPPIPPTPASVEADHRELAWLLGVLRREHNRVSGSTPYSAPSRTSPDQADTMPIDLSS